MKSVVKKSPRQILGQTFVEENAHSDRRQQSFAALFQEGHSLLPADRRKILQKFVQRVPAFQGINQCAGGKSLFSELFL